ncbi:MAG TPA: translation initiation factor IF-2 N-terminal domain-containing protein [Pseudonocardiaceae bacterium]
MSNAEQPAGTAGGDSGAPTEAANNVIYQSALNELPARVRVHALAKLLERSSREVLDALAELGQPARSAQSSLDRELATKIAAMLTGGAAGGDADNNTLVHTGADMGAGTGATEPESARVAEPTPRESTPRESTPRESTPRESTRPEPAAPGSTPPGSTPPELTPPMLSAAPVPEALASVQPAWMDPAGQAALAPVFAAPSPMFLPPTMSEPQPAQPPAATSENTETETEEPDQASTEDESGRSRRRRRGRRGRGRGKGGNGDDHAENGEEQAEEQPEEPETDTAASANEPEDSGDAADTEDADGGAGGNRRRRRRRRRKGGGEDSASSEDDPPNTVVHVRDGREGKEKSEKSDRSDRPESSNDEVRSVRGSTRLEAKRQRRRDGRDAGRRRAPILSEAEFLARRESVDRKMVVREADAGAMQIGVLEDGVLVEHFVSSSGTGSLVGNVYLGRVQNVLPSMEAAFVDIGRGRNAVLYAGEVDWDAAGLEGKARKIEQALSTGDSVLVQVTKDPVGHKGARLTTQISLPGRFLVYVPGGGATGISRKLPDTERKRLKEVLKRVVPEDAGVIIRTASEGVSEDELGRDVRRLRAQWEVIHEKAQATSTKAPQLLYEEPDLLIKVIRDLFTEDFSELIVQGSGAWDTIDAYVKHVAPDLEGRLRRHASNTDVLAEFRIDEQILKALDRKVWLPSGGTLVIDRTEAMTVIDVNTGKFTGAGGNLEETVTRNNLEAAEEIVRQLRLRDIGGIIVIDFIDMVLESNRDLVLRRLTECLGRDRTRHQVAEVTSLGLVQMTRKRVGTGLLEAYSTTCEHCRGRGILVSTTPVASEAKNGNGGGNGGGNSGNSGNSGGSGGGNGGGTNGRKAKHREPEVVEAEAPASPAASVIRSIHEAAEPVAESGVVALETVESPTQAAPAQAPAEAGAAPAAESVSAAVTQTNGHVAGEPQPTTVRPEVASEQAEPAQATDGEPERPLVFAHRRRSRRAASRPAGPPISEG